MLLKDVKLVRILSDVTRMSDHFDERDVSPKSNVLYSSSKPGRPHNVWLIEVPEFPRADDRSTYRDPKM